MKPVRCIETGEIFPSLSEAGRVINSSSYQSTGADRVVHSHISHAVHGHGGSQTAGGYHWELIHKDSKVSSIFPQKEKEETLPKIYKNLGRKPPSQVRMDYPPEGYVYIFRNRWHPSGVYKIGSTDNLQDRRSAARTWGPYKCEFYLEVTDCKLVESMVHYRLRDYAIKAEDLGQEHFSIDLEKAISLIKGTAADLLKLEAA